MRGKHKRRRFRRDPTHRTFTLQLRAAVKLCQAKFSKERCELELGHEGCHQGKENFWVDGDVTSDDLVMQLAKGPVVNKRSRAIAAAMLARDPIAMAAITQRSKV